VEHSDLLNDHVVNPRNVGRIENPDASGQAGRPGRGPFMVMHFRIADGVVTEVKYQTFGCGPAIAAGSMLTQLVKGRSVEACLALTEQELAEALGGLPSEKTWCADLAIRAMCNALAEYPGPANSGRTKNVSEQKDG